MGPDENGPGCSAHYAHPKSNLWTEPAVFVRAGAFQWALGGRTARHVLLGFRNCILNVRLVRAHIRKIIEPTKRIGATVRLGSANAKACFSAQAKLKLPKA